MLYDRICKIYGIWYKIYDIIYTIQYKVYGISLYKVYGTYYMV